VHVERPLGIGRDATVAQGELAHAKSPKVA